MVVGGKLLSAELLQRVEQAAPSCSRRQLAGKLCEWLDWRGPTGRFQHMSARKALAQLERSGQIRLPAAQPGPPRPPVVVGPPSAEAVPPKPLSGSLDQFTPIEVVPVGHRRSPLAQEWNRLMRQFHYLGAGPLCGAQLRYLIRSSQGVVGALAFSAAACRLAGRDRWIGWNDTARREQLHRVVNNSRFLILPHVTVPNLASCALAKALDRLPEDWQARYGYRPVLVETFVERGRFNHGGCYGAANWQSIGITAGRGRQDAAHQTDRKSVV